MTGALSCESVAYPFMTIILGANSTLGLPFYVIFTFLLSGYFHFLNVLWIYKGEFEAFFWWLWC